MTALQTFFVLMSVLMVVVGQLLFKLVGVRLHSGLSVMDPKVWGIVIISIVIYTSATVLWIAILRTVPLVKAYPYMALSFFLVPLGGIMLYSERVQWTYPIGALLIVFGVVLTTLQPRI